MSEQSGKYTIRISTVNDGAGAKAAAGDFEKLNVHSREFRHILSQIGGGEFAELARAMGGPFLIAEGLVQIYKQINIALTQIHDQQLKLIEDGRSWHEALDNAAHSSLQTVIDRTAEWSRHLEHLNDSYDELTKKMERQSALDKLRTSEMAAQNNLAASLAEAQVNTAEAEGALTKEQAENRIMAIKLRQKELDDQIAEQARTREQAGYLTRGSQAAESAGKADADRMKAEAEREPLQHQKNVQEVYLKKAEAYAEEIRKDSAKAQAEMDARVKAIMADYGGTKEDTTAAFAKAHPEIARRANAGPDADAQVLKTKDIIDAIENQIKSKDAEIKASQELFDSMAKLSREMNEKADALAAENNAIHGANATGYGQQEAINREAATGRAVAMSKTAFPNPESVPIGPNFSESPDVNAERDIAQGAALIDRMHRNLPTSAAAIRALLRDIQSLHGENQEFADALRDIAAQLGANGPH